MAINILITGNCGVGKTYVIKKLINSLQVPYANNVGLLRYLHNDQYIVTGAYVGDMFDGSDKLAMNVMSSLDEFLQKNNNHIIFYEGDRFTNSRRWQTRAQATQQPTNTTPFKKHTNKNKQYKRRLRIKKQQCLFKCYTALFNA